MRRHGAASGNPAGGSLAQRANVRCCLEHTRDRPADIVLGPAGSELVAEVKVVLLDERAAAGGRGDHVLGQALNELAFRHRVDFDGQMTVRLSEDPLCSYHDGSPSWRLPLGPLPGRAVPGA